MIDYSRPFAHWRGQGLNLDGVYIPHEALGFDPSCHPHYACLPANSPGGRLLKTAYNTLRGQLNRITVAESSRLAEGFSALVRALIFGEDRGLTESAQLRQSRRDAMCAYIERNLRSRSLGVGDLLRDFAITRPTLFRDFAACGGVARYIANRRLERAFIDLVARPPTKGAVREVSERWGFESASHFSRRFRARFGVLPSEIVGSAARRPAFLEPKGSNLRSGHHMADWFSRSMPRPAC